MDSSVMQIAAPPSARMKVTPDTRDSVDVVWYSEQDLTLELHAGRDCSMSHIAAELIGAPSSAQRTQIVRGIMSIIGFTTLGYATLLLRSGRPVRACLLNTYMPGRSQASYFRKRYYEVDPRAPLGPLYGAPMIWNLDELRARTARRQHDRRVPEFLHDMEADHMNSGIMFGIPHPKFGLFSVISLSSTDARRGWMDSGTVGQSLALGLAVHRVASGYARAIARPSNLPYPVGIQRKMLGCLVAGMSDRDIALSLNMTPHDLHESLSLLQERYFVSNRTQLAALAGLELAV